MPVATVIFLILLWPILGLLAGLGAGALLGKKAAKKPTAIFGLLGGIAFGLWFLMKH